MLVHSAVRENGKTHSVAIEGKFTRGFSAIQIIGNCTEVCRQGLERARTAIEETGLTLSQKRLVISLSPADIRKDGPQLDLALAISIYGVHSPDSLFIDPDEWSFAGELGLGGEIRSVPYMLSFAMEAVRAEKRGIVLASEQASALLHVSSLGDSPLSRLEVVGAESLQDVIEWLKTGFAPELKSTRPPEFKKSEQPDFDDMLLSPLLEKMALLLGAGGHSLLMMGSPGSGKSMFSRRIVSVLPPLERKTHLDVLLHYSLAALDVSPSLLFGLPPFRAPHHQASGTSILGGGEFPGELALAHGGVLFLDELPEFRRDVLEGLREPLETKEVRVARAAKKTSWPADALLVTALNPCPCGWLGSTRKRCICPMNRIQAYRRKVSGPILDRIDLHINMPEQDPGGGFFTPRANKIATTEGLKEKILVTKEWALQRSSELGAIKNHDIPSNLLQKASGLDEGDFLGLLDAIPRIGLTHRSLAKMLRVARTLADLDGLFSISPEHVQEAYSYSHEFASKTRLDENVGLR